MKNSNVRRTPKVFYSSWRPAVARNKKSDLKKYRFILYAVIFIAFIFGLSYVPAFRIKNVQVDTDNPQIVNALDSLNGQFLFGSSTDHEVNTLIQSNLTINNLYCKKGIPSSLKCFVTFREPLLTWQAKDKYLLVDKNGLAYQQVSAPNDKILLVQDMIKDGNVGDKVISPQVIDTYKSLVDLLKTKSLLVSRLMINDTTFQVDAALSNGKTARFNITGSLQGQVDTLSSLLTEHPDLAKTVIDLRVPNSIYTK